MSIDVEPIHAQAFFRVDRKGLFTEILVFDYLDKENFYYKILEDEERYVDEMMRLSTVMNEFLEEEKIIINNRRVEAKVTIVNLEFRGAPELPTIIYIIEFSGELVNGLNVYECYYEGGVAEYDYEIYWIFPEDTEIVKVDISGEHEILNHRILISSVRRGEKYKGYEKIVFKLE
ncbi:MAG: hypothetical protein QXK95_02975 [Nitrososphaerota archaeon]